MEHRSHGITDAVSHYSQTAFQEFPWDSHEFPWDGTNVPMHPMGCPIGIPTGIPVRKPSNLLVLIGVHTTTWPGAVRFGRVGNRVWGGHGFGICTVLPLVASAATCTSTIYLYVCTVVQ